MLRSDRFQWLLNLLMWSRCWLQIFLMFIPKKGGKMTSFDKNIFSRWMVQPLTSDFMTEIYGTFVIRPSHRHSWKVGDMYPLVNSSWMTGNSPIFFKSPERMDVPVSKAFAGVNRHVALRFSSNQRGGPANQSQFFWGEVKNIQWYGDFLHGNNYKRVWAYIFLSKVV